jgi:hypothetical protein
MMATQQLAVMGPDYLSEVLFAMAKLGHVPAPKFLRVSMQRQRPTCMCSSQAHTTHKCCGPGLSVNAPLMLFTACNLLPELLV